MFSNNTITIYAIDAINEEIEMNIGFLPDVEPDTELADATVSMEACGIELQELSDEIDLDTSTEGLLIVLKNVSAIQSKFVASLKKTVTLGHSKYKTEYSEWYKKNKSTIAKVERMSYDDASQFDIDAPTGMTGTYVDVMDAISKYQQVSDIMTVISNSSMVVDSILTSISQGSSDCEQQLSKAIVMLTAVSKKANDYHNVVLSMFDINDQRVEKKEFKEHFANMIELKDYRDQLKEASDVVSNMPNISKAVTNIEKGVDTCVNYITDTEERDENEYTPSAKFVKQFATYLGMVDSSLVGYGDIALRVMALTHNTTFVYSSLGGKRG